MKVWSKEAFLLGGICIYGVLSTPFTYFHNNISEQIFSLILALFIILMLFLCLNKVPSFITYILKQHPDLSYYLISIGWVAYFLIIGIVVLPVLAGIFEWQDTTIEKTTSIFNFICNWGILISLLVAFIKSKLSKQ